MHPLPQSEPVPQRAARGQASGLTLLAVVAMAVAFASSADTARRMAWTSAGLVSSLVCDTAVPAVEHAALRNARRAPSRAAVLCGVGVATVRVLATSAVRLEHLDLPPPLA
ncbi:MAG: hypothetical protein ACTS22_06240 [Phycisphaerales bacterium]